jgi:hypothetical protein
MAQAGSDAPPPVANRKPEDYYDPQLNPEKLAAYTGFEDIADLQRFLVSRPMLEVTAEIIRDGYLMPIKWKDIFRLLALYVSSGHTEAMNSTYGEKVDLKKSFPAQFQEANRKYPSSNSIRRMAAWIFRLRNRIQSYEREDPKLRRMGLVAARKIFKTVTASAGQFIVPCSDPAVLKFPVLGPRKELNEDYLEPYNRVYHLSFQLGHYARSKISAPYVALFGPEPPFLSKPVSPEVIREAKRAQQKVGNIRNSGGKRALENVEHPDEKFQKKQKFAPKIVKAPIIERAPENPQLPPKKFAYKWLSGLDHQDAKGHLNTIESQLQRTGFIDQDPTQVHCCEFRNFIRCQLDFAKHKVQLHSLQLQYSSRDGDEQIPSWDSAVKILGEDFGDSLKEVVINFGVRLLGEDETLLEKIRKPAFMDLMSIDDKY